MYPVHSAVAGTDIESPRTWESSSRTFLFLVVIKDLRENVGAFCPNFGTGLHYKSKGYVREEREI